MNKKRVIPLTPKKEKRAATLAFLIIADLLRKRCPRLYRASVSPVLSWSVLAALLLWWVLRNVFYCSWL